MEVDERVIALRVSEPILVARMERISREVLSSFKAGKLSQEQVAKLKADWDAARSLLGVLTEAAGGQING